MKVRRERQFFLAVQTCLRECLQILRNINEKVLKFLFNVLQNL